MPRKEAAKIELSEREREILKRINIGTHSPLHLRMRTGIILLASDGKSNNRIEKEKKVCGETVTLWRNRYYEAHEELVRVEKEEPRKLRMTIEKTLSDAARPGAPTTFTAEQVACIIAASCEKPENLGFPFSHWTRPLLRDYVIEKGIVDSISAMQIGRFLKRSGI